MPWPMSSRAVAVGGGVDFCVQPDQTFRLNRFGLPSETAMLKTVRKPMKPVGPNPDSAGFDSKGHMASFVACIRSSAAALPSFSLPCFESRAPPSSLSSFVASTNLRAVIRVSSGGKRKIGNYLLLSLPPPPAPLVVSLPVHRSHHFVVRSLFPLLRVFSPPFHGYSHCQGVNTVLRVNTPKLMLLSLGRPVQFYCMVPPSLLH
ncbi:hypothetical protein PIB30_023107 [Stylosanthes scabra]|uniref:Uncharacterized protein n=1 Tax=Stylosanthes scabra TaxID=79078 RepID=A0ABU6Z637_9FABA|nr:hypothetical protein [Stylosanthes scabra]